MDLTNPLLSLSSSTCHRVLAVVAAATEPLSGREIANRAGVSDRAALHALDYLATGGVVSRLKCSNVTLHVLDHLHVARELVLALTDLPARVVARVADTVAEWELAPQAVALRWPCPSQVDLKGGEMIDLLVIAGASGDDDAERWRAAVDDLVGWVTRWSGNHVHLHERAHSERQMVDDELVATPWTVVVGKPPDDLPLVDSGVGESAASSVSPVRR